MRAVRRRTLPTSMIKSEQVFLIVPGGLSITCCTFLNYPSAWYPWIRKYIGQSLRYLSIENKQCSYLSIMSLPSVLSASFEHSPLRQEREEYILIYLLFVVSTRVHAYRWNRRWSTLNRAGLVLVPICFLQTYFACKSTTVPKGARVSREPRISLRPTWGTRGWRMPPLPAARTGIQSTCEASL